MTMAGKNIAAVKRGSRRTVSMTLRIDPMVRYGIELVARRTHRSITATIEAALEEWLLSTKADDERSYFDPGFISELWHHHPGVRLVKMALYDIRLLLPEEYAVWDAIQEDDSLWNGDRSYPNLKVQDLMARWPELLRIHES